MNVTLDQMRDRLFTVEDVSALLQKTEPMTSAQVNSETAVHFDFTDGWAENLEQVQDTETVNVLMTINGTERQMTKEAALMAAANIGLSSSYVRKTPADLIEANLNYWYANLSKEYTALSVNGVISAFTRPTLVPFSNLNLLDSVVAGIQQKYGDDTEILADYKVNNSLLRTDIRLILPEHQRTISNGGLPDVPHGEADVWSQGVHLSNSLVGRSQTSVDAYLFRWWCTNGATTTQADVGTWSRRANGQEDDIYVWAQESVDAVLGGMEHKFAAVEALTRLPLNGNAAEVLRQIYTDYAIPVSQREAISALVLEAESLTMYTIMNAITQVANTPGLSSERADRLMRIGGAVPTTTFDTLKAKIWREGHTAADEDPNPYEITAVEA